VRNALRWAGALLALAISSGCAITDATIQVMPKVGGTAKVAAPKTVLLGEITDSRKWKNREGTKKNGYGMELASIFVKPKAPDLVRTALAAELRAAGFEVLEASPASREHVVVDVSLTQLFTEVEVGLFAGDVYGVVDATVTVTLPSGGKYRRRFVGLGQRTTLIWTEGYFQESLELALTAFTRQSIAALVELLDGPGPVGGGKG
jgi:uncharacterized lipoprotein YajG